MPRKQVTNWGNFPVVSANVTVPSEINELRHLVIGKRDIIARGNGRCYGDSSLGENIVSTLKLNHFLSFDRDGATLECESGVLLSEILDVI
ncbi:MAG: FAD-binding protein, partial [bacterium]|nr:FAD-binding protein [bacterium]